MRSEDLFDVINYIDCEEVEFEFDNKRKLLMSTSSIDDKEHIKSINESTQRRT